VRAATLRTGLFARWWGWLSVAGGVLLIVGATARARDGFWSPTGGMSFICFIVFLVWVLVTSILLTMRMRERRASAAPAT
jgi:hypothetical protein